jgi:hypothetical protein
MKTILLLLIFFIISCNRLSPIELEIRETLGKKVNLEMITKIQDKNEFINFDKFRNKYKYIHLVYLKNSCAPCYSTYIRWQKEMSLINKPDDYTVLFIINGNSYNEFISEATKAGFETDYFYTFMDSDDTFTNGNKNISQSMIKRTLLIDDKNQVVLIGSPFSTDEMRKVFNELFFKQGNLQR